MSNAKATLPRHASRRAIRILCECGIMLALATVLSLLPIWKFPWGGSITFLSMLPITVISCKYGLKVGLPAAFVYSLIQLGLDLATLMGWGMTLGTWAGCLFFDYIGAFTVLGLAGIFRRRGTAGLIAGVSLSIVLRYICHVISGSIFFGIYAWEGWAPLPYSLCYNGAYMLPELIATVIATVILFRLPTFSRLVRE